MSLSPPNKRILLIGMVALIVAAIATGFLFHHRTSNGRGLHPSFSGVVRNPRGWALAGATVEALWIATDAANPQVLQSARTGPSGEYQLSARPPPPEDGVFLLMASAEGYESHGRKVDSSERVQNFILAEGSCIATVLVEDESGAPIANAQVILSAEPLASEPNAVTVHTGLTGSDGRSIFPRITNVAARLHWSARAPKRGRAFGTLSKGWSEPTVYILARLRTGVQLSGLVQDLDSRPVETIALGLSEQPGPWGERVKTDGQGRFLVEDVPAGVGLVLTVRADGYQLAGAQDELSFSIPAQAKQHELQVKVEPAGLITGTVTRAKGEAIEGATVEAIPSDRKMTTRRVVASDINGRFRIGGLRLDTQWELEARHPEFAPAFVSGIRPGKRGTETRIILAEGGALTGQVEYENHSPAAGVEVYAHRVESTGKVIQGLKEHATQRTAEDGRYLIEHLNSGPYRIEVRARARMAWASIAAKNFEVQVEEGVTRALDTVRLTRPGALEVRLVVDGQDGSNQLVQVALMQQGAQGAPHRLTVQSGGGGQVLLTDLEAGRYDLSAHLQTHGFASFSGVEVRAGETSKAELVFQERLVLQGMVRQPDGNPALQAKVDAFLIAGGSQNTYPLPGRAPDNFSGNSTGTDEEGRFRLAGLEPGRYLLRATAEGQSPVERVVEVRSKIANVGLDFLPAASCEVAVMDERDRPATSKIVVAESTSNIRYSASSITDTNGSAVFRDLPAGRFQLRVVAPHQPTAECQVRAGEAKKVAIRLAHADPPKSSH